MQQDAPADAVPTIQVENERVRVVEWRFAPGAHTGWHVHEYDYVVVPQTDGLLKIDTSDGWQQAELTAGVPYYRQAGVEHDVYNGGERELVFVEVEIKAHGIAPA